MERRWIPLPARPGTGPSARVQSEGCRRTTVSGVMSGVTGRARPARPRLDQPSVAQTGAMKQSIIMEAALEAAAVRMPGEGVLVPIGTGLSALLR